MMKECICLPRSPYTNRDNEAMVQMLVTVLAHSFSRRQPADDRKTFAGALRSSQYIKILKYDFLPSTLTLYNN